MKLRFTENPYLQYFSGLPGYQDAPPFDASTLVLFHKRITADMLSEANEYLLAHKDDDQPGHRLLEMVQLKAAYQKRKEATKGFLPLMQPVPRPTSSTRRTSPC